MIDELATVGDEAEARPSADADGEPRKRRRRGRRGGRRNRREGEDGVEKAPSPAGEDGLTPAQAEAVGDELLAQAEVAEAKIEAEPAAAPINEETS